jgi:hypothetical protein
MDYRVDQQGKYYTAHITKETAPVMVATLTSISHGSMHVTRDSRFKDELNSTERFVAITNAEVFDLSDQTQLYSSEVLLLNKELIVWVIPQEESQPADEEERSE